MPLREAILQRLSEAGGKLRVRSALNPILWLCGIVTLPTVYIMSQLPIDPPLWAVLLACAPVAAAIFGFLFLLLFDRDKLQSEDYQVRMRSLELIQQKGDNVPISATSIEAISNPDYRRLGRGRDRGDADQ